MVVTTENTREVGGRGKDSPLPPGSSGKKGFSVKGCDDFRNEATPPEQFDELCFRHLTARTTSVEEGIVAVGSGGSVAEVSCASSVCSLGGNLSDGGSCHGIKGNASAELINAKLVKRTTSRHGRSSQRWVADRLSPAAIRLTTGCVPIVKGGKVLFVSASSKPSWIFPKGGWENDEKMEESALREAYEEAGVIGILGPKLSEVQYETRKGRKRRLEREEMLKQKRGKLETTEQSTKDDCEEKKGLEMAAMPAPPTAAVPSPSVASEVVIDTTAMNHKATPNPAPVSDEAFARMRGHVINNAKRHADETSSVQSETNYNQVKMSLFPLYVTSIKKEWPESGRLRRAVPIDEAIQILESRPELQAALVEVKKKGLHLVAESLEI